jgi:hypothetical protein
MGDQPRDPLAALRVPPTQAQVLEHMREEIEYAIFVARSADDLAAVAGLLEQAREEAEKLLAERGAPPRLPSPPPGGP